MVKWCDENNINIKTYYYWQRRVLNAVCNELAIAENNVEKSPTFSEIILPGTRTSEVAITLTLNNISPQIHNGADESVISQTLKVLRNIC